MADLTVIILTYNEAQHIGRAIASVAGFARRVIVVDSFSTDDTTLIAASAGAEIVQRRFVNQAEQLQWALGSLAIHTAWVMRLDADEIVEPPLGREIEATLAKLPPGVTGLALKRKHIFCGRWIRFGGRYPVILLRIWRNGTGRVEPRWMDEHIVVSHGTVRTLRAPFSDCNLNDLAYFIGKHNSYATREAVQLVLESRNLIQGADLVTASNLSITTALIRRIKRTVYNRIPYELASLCYFLFRYVFLLGFLDGRAGLVYHFLQGLWYRFLVGARRAELERLLRGVPQESVAPVLAAHTGLAVDMFVSGVPTPPSRT